MNDIIGISAYYHDSSVALIRDGKITAFIKEESITRVKGTSTFPKQALKYLINNFSVNQNSIQSVCFYEKPLRGWLSLLSHSLERPYERWRQSASLLKKFWDGPVFFSEELNKVLPIPRDKILYCEHHLSHALCGWLHTKGHDDWVIVILDGVGDGETGSIFSVKDGEINRIWRDVFPNSLGLFYSAVTDYLGYAVNDGEYKVMALAAYGQPTYLSDIQKIITFSEERLHLDLSYLEFHKNPERSYSDKFIDVFGKPATDFSNPFGSASPEYQRFCDIAASAQKWTEELVKKVVDHAISVAECRNVVFAGGVAHNCVAVAQLMENEAVNQLVVPPSPGDSGAALGAALYAYMGNGIERPPKPVIYPGASPAQPNVMDKLFRLAVDKETMFERSADLLKQGDIIATFLGNCEMGPRALGHRSLLCNAADEPTVERLNFAIKKREKFRPLAPMLKIDSAYQYFHICRKNVEIYSWMGSVATARPHTHARFSAVLHIDGSARLQTVTKNQQYLWDFLTACEARDMPMLVNTSFNIAGDPIVFDYIDCFVNMHRMGIKWLLTNSGLYECLNV